MKTTKIRWVTIIGSLAVSLTLTSAATAGTYTDDLAKCLVKSSSDTDKANLGKAMFAIFSLNPAVKSLVAITPSQRDALLGTFGDIMQRLLIVDCRKETVDALKYEGDGAIEASFTVLGNVAGRSLASAPEVGAGLRDMATHLDKSKFDALFKEAGITPNDQSAPKPSSSQK